MRKFFVLSLALFLILGLGMSFAAQPVDGHKDHKHESVVELQSSYPCPYCSYGTVYQTNYVGPTCTEDGYQTYSCDNCYYESTSTISATGHDWYQIPNRNYYECYTCGERLYY